MPRKNMKTPRGVFILSHTAGEGGTIMRIHVDSREFVTKPTGPQIGGIKARITKEESIKDLSIEQIAEALTAGRTVQPGVTPFSEKSKAEKRKGTVKEDFAEQTIFMIDIDNKRDDVPPETSEHVVEVLSTHNLKAAFMYETFSSTEEALRFRFAVVADEAITDKEERDCLQASLISLFPQADADCINADRIFFGTDKGLILSDWSAVCARDDLSALIENNAPEQEAQWPRYGTVIPTGHRHDTLLNTAVSMIKKYGISDRAHEVFMQRAAQCEKPLPEKELKRIWSDACSFYEKKISTEPGYVLPEAYAAEDCVSGTFMKCQRGFIQ